jgi:hypothetical protein
MKFDFGQRDLHKWKRFTVNGIPHWESNLDSACARTRVQVNFQAGQAPEIVYSDG